MTCPNCAGTGKDEISVGDPNDWEVLTTTCARCEGAGEVPDIRCARCNRYSPADEAVNGGTLDGLLLGFYFCAACAEVLAEPPAYPHALPAIVPARAAGEDSAGARSPVAFLLEGE
jgi:hypothetical protein